jgi:hypothetical protein
MGHGRCVEKKTQNAPAPPGICNLMKDCAEEPYCTLSLARAIAPFLPIKAFVKQTVGAFGGMCGELITVPERYISLAL